MDQEISRLIRSLTAGDASQIPLLGQYLDRGLSEAFPVKMLTDYKAELWEFKIHSNQQSIWRGIEPFPDIEIKHLSFKDDATIKEEISLGVERATRDRLDDSHLSDILEEFKIQIASQLNGNAKLIFSQTT